VKNCDGQCMGVICSHLRKTVLVTLISLIICNSGYCQDGQKLTLPENPSQGGTLTVNPLDSFQFYLAGMVLGFGLIIIFSQFFMLRNVKNLSADDIARNCVITIVTTTALLLVIVGYSSAQIAAAFGLFGTIIGYLLGKSNRPPADENRIGPLDTESSRALDASIASRAVPPERESRG
jgi:hypothetical protein